jgi:hypothetical protein
MLYSVGQDIESICGKCGDVWHVVVAIAKGKIAKVLCKQCGGQHRYKPPDGVAVATPRKKTTRAGTKKKTILKIEPGAEGPLVQPDPARALRSYGLSESFDVGDPVEHKTFGTGVVELVLEDRKIQVFFPGGRKVLAHQRF